MYYNEAPLRLNFYPNRRLGLASKTENAALQDPLNVVFELRAADQPKQSPNVDQPSIFKTQEKDNNIKGNFLLQVANDCFKLRFINPCKIKCLACNTLKNI